jgi:methionine-rich copper-binding protein CopC
LSVRTQRRTMVWLGLGALVCLGPALPAWAHANLVRSFPAGDAVVTEPPPLIQAWFSEEVAVKGSVMRLYDSGNKVLAAGGVDLKDRDHESMKITPPLLAPGAYQVRWHAISADDNHVTEDVFRFSVRPVSRAPHGPMLAFFSSLLPIRLR